MKPIHSFKGNTFPTILFHTYDVVSKYGIESYMTFLRGLDDEKEFQ